MRILRMSSSTRFKRVVPWLEAKATGHVLEAHATFERNPRALRNGPALAGSGCGGTLPPSPNETVGA